MPDAAPPDARRRKPPRADAAREQKPLRADAARNRQRILAAAREAFAAHGPSVSLDDIALRAGVGAGTVHRHFPTKDELVTAVIADRLAELAEAARQLAGAADPGEAFFGYLHRLAGDARENLALSAALTDPASVGEAVREAGAALETALATVLARAQRAGAVRRDIDTTALHAILAGALVMEERLPPAARGRGLDIVVDGLRAAGSTGRRDQPGSRRDSGHRPR